MNPLLPIDSRVLEVLERGRQWIAETWHSGAPTSGSECTITALMANEGEPRWPQARSEAIRLLISVLWGEERSGLRRTLDWNDHETTKAHVLELYDRTIRLARDLSRDAQGDQYSQTADGVYAR